MLWLIAQMVLFDFRSVVMGSLVLAAVATRLPGRCSSSVEPDVPYGAIVGKVKPKSRILPHNQVDERVTVTITPTGERIATDTEGNFVIHRIPPGHYEVSAALDTLSGQTLLGPVNTTV